LNLTTLLLVASVGMIVGAFLILRISSMDFTQGIFQRLTSAPKSIRSEINESTHRKKKSFLRREIEDAQTILKATGKEARFPMICAVSFLLFAIGAGIAIVMGNFFLVPVMAVGMMFIPFWYVKLTAGHFKKDVSSELETALSIITYLCYCNPCKVFAVNSPNDLGLFFVDYIFAVADFRVSEHQSSIEDDLTVFEFLLVRPFYISAHRAGFLFRHCCQYGN